ncbi:MAG TPA: hypothetical protein VNE62_07155, partial [Actinomycetota bacterium]|nr:hypothetical protein [Actinomycetota bacterium]
MEARPAGSGAVDPDDIQKELLGLPGVQAVRVVTSGRGRVTEVHIVANGAKSAKQIVRDVQTVAMAKYGIELDYRVVSVVKFDE